MSLKNARIAILLDDLQLAYHLGKVLMKNGAIIYSKSQVERYKACGLALVVDVEISDGALQLLDAHHQYAPCDR